MRLSLPSFRNGLARSRSESENKSLWDGLKIAWCPSLGVTGKKVFDASGSGRHDGSFTNMELDEWKIRAGIPCISTGGTNEIVQNTSSSVSEFDGEQRATIVAWLRCNSSSNSCYAGFRGNALGRTGLLWFQKTTVFFIVDTGLTTAFSSYSFSGSGFHQFVLVYDGTLASSNKFRGYIDGKRVAGGADTRTSLAGSSLYGFCFGSDHSGTTVRYWAGDYSDTLAYNRVLSDSEIRHLYSDRLAPFRRKRRTIVRVPEGGGGFQAAWAARATQVIGSGVM